jgi:iron complex outermembrane receptor protein
VAVRRAIGQRHALVAGGGYRAGGRRASGKVRAWSVDERLHTTSAFVHDAITIGDRWHLTAGSTVEHNPYTGLQAQPTLRLLWRPTEAQAVWWAVSRGVATGRRRVKPALPTRESESVCRLRTRRPDPPGAGRSDAVHFDKVI